jgi:hypothetical protein
MHNRALWRITSMIPDRKPTPMPRFRHLIYHGVKVRRGFSILLVLIFSLGPLSAVTSASEEASLPACCRRNGAHHCVMAMDGMAAAMVVPPGAPPIAKAPSHCPYYPQHATIRNTPVHALTVSYQRAPVPFAQTHGLRTGRAAPLLIPVSPLTGRGPPKLAIA